MVFENLIKIFNSNYHKAKDTKKILRFLAYEYNNLKFKKSKLKLGKIRFEIRETKVGDVVVNRFFEMVFTEQPTTWAFRQNFENALKRYSWRWDFQNITALIMLLALAFNTLLPMLWDYLESIFPTILGDTPEADIELVRFTLMTLAQGSYPFINTFFRLITDLITFFKFLV